METSSPSSRQVHGESGFETLYQSPVQCYAGSFLSTVIEKATTPIAADASNREFLASALFPIVNLFTQYVTFAAHSQMPKQPKQEDVIEMQQVPLSGSNLPTSIRSPQEEQEHSRLSDTVKFVHLDSAKLKSLAVGNIAITVIAIAVALLGGLGFTLIHGLAHATILCSVINLVDIATVVKKQGISLDQFSTNFSEVVQSNSPRQHQAQPTFPSRPATTQEVPSSTQYNRQEEMKVPGSRSSQHHEQNVWMKNTKEHNKTSYAEEKQQFTPTTRRRRKRAQNTTPFSRQQDPVQQQRMHYSSVRVHDTHSSNEDNEFDQ